MKYELSHALSALKPGAQWVCRGEVFSGIEWLDGSQSAPTELEINTKIAELNAAEPMRLLRVERDKRISKTDWRALPDLTMSDDWKKYRQALRDLPASSSPRLGLDYELDLTSVNWPTEPS